MADEFGFGSQNANFDELLKKYKAIDEPDAVKPQQGTAQNAPISPKEDFLLDEDDFEDELDDIFEDDDEQDSEAGGLTFDASEMSVGSGEPFAQTQKAEPKFAYDLNMFGSSAQKAFDVDSFDNSWLDNSLDESIFYQPAPVSEQPKAKAEEYAYETAEETAPENEETANKIEDFFDSAKTSNFIPRNESAKVNITDAAGGYVAPEDEAADFTFDDDSGVDFGEDDGYSVAEYQTPAELEGLPVFTPAVPDKKGRKIKSKKEVNAVTSFSKDYKAGGEDNAPAKKKGNFFKNNFIPSKADSAAEILRKIVMTVAVLAVICSGIYLFNDYVIMPYRNEKDMGELNGMLGDSNEVIDELSMHEKYPDIDFPDGMLEKYADLYARNQDLVGWIEIDGLDISLPVVQGEDNKQYLKNDFDGKSSKYGSIFMNYTNSFETLNYNTTLFGHHMKDQKMFGKLKQYKTVEGYKKAPVIEFNTLYADYKWKVFAVFITNGTSAGDNGYLFNYMFTDLSTNAKVEEFLGEIKLRSIYYPEVDIALSDKILTLSTCTYELTDGRLVIMARMVRPGESEYVNVENVRYNANPRYPQGYYTKNEKSNPYTDYAKWYPS